MVNISWAQYSILASSTSNRNGLMQSLNDNNIPSNIYYRLPLHLQKVFDDLEYTRCDFPISEKVAERIFSIHMHPYLYNVDQDKIIEVLNSV